MCSSGMPNSYSVYSSLKSHIVRQHHGISKKERSNNIVIDVEWCCNIADCKQKCEGVSKLFSHLRYHITKGDEISCPFLQCGKKFHNESSFSSHLSRIHKEWSTSGSDTDTAGFLVPDVIVETGDVYSNSGKSTSDVDDTEGELDLQPGLEDGDVVSILESETWHGDLLHNLALFLLKLQTKRHVPVAGIQSIIEELQAIQDLSSSYVAQQIKTKLDSLEHDGLKLTRNVVDEIVEFVKNDPISTMLNAEKSPLRSVQTRKTYFTKTFSYVEPVAYRMLCDGERKKCFHYYYFGYRAKPYPRALSVCNNYRFVTIITLR